MAELVAWTRPSAHPGRVTSGPRRPVKLATVGALYEIRVKGRITGALLEHFEDMGAHVQPGGTVLRGTVQDQAALHGLLDRIESVGLELIEVRRMPAEV